MGAGRHGVTGPGPPPPDGQAQGAASSSFFGPASGPASGPSSRPAPASRPASRTRPKAVTVPEQGAQRPQDPDVVSFMSDYRRQHGTEGGGGKGGGARVNFTQLRREFSYKMTEMKQSLERVHTAEMEAFKASQELAVDKERKALILKSEEDKQAALAFVNDSWQVHLVQETGKLQQLQKTNMDDMEAFYQNELKVQLEKQRLRMEESYEKQREEEEEANHQKELVKLRAEASDLKASREFWKNSANEWKEKLQDPWADSDRFACFVAVWGSQTVLSELPCVIGADQDLQEKGRVKKEEKSAAKAKAPPVSATERFKFAACLPTLTQDATKPPAQADPPKATVV